MNIRKRQQLRLTKAIKKVIATLKVLKSSMKRVNRTLKWN